jgi:peptidoglycan/LPS O-acetylase OafA/YrhL
MVVTRFYSLDVFRGFAALSVAAGHYIIDGAVLVDGRLPQAETFSVLWNFSFIYAVDFFLVLSGFILAHSYLYRLDVTFKDFALRRFFRMYPLHFLTMTFALWTLVALGQNPRVSDIVLHTLFIQNMGFGPNGLALNIPAWTISVEFWINVGAFLLLVLFRNHRRVILACMLVIAVLCFALIAWRSGHLNVNDTNYKNILNAGLLRCSASFVLGLIVYELYRKFQGWVAPMWLVVSCALMFFAIVMTLPGHTLWGFAAPWLFAGIVFVLATSESKTSNVMKPWVWLGDVSFSVYLVHHPFVGIFRESGVEKSVTSVIAFVLLVYCLAFIAHKFFERPSYRWLLQKTAKFRTPAAR